MEVMAEEFFKRNRESLERHLSHYNNTRYHSVEEFRKIHGSITTTSAPYHGENSRLHQIEGMIETFSKIREISHHLKGTARGPWRRRIDEKIENLSVIGENFGIYLRNYTLQNSHNASDQHQFPSQKEETEGNPVNNRLLEIEEIFGKFTKLRDAALHLKNTAQDPKLRRIDGIIEKLCEIGEDLGTHLIIYYENVNKHKRHISNHHGSSTIKRIFCFTLRLL